MKYLKISIRIFFVINDLFDNKKMIEKNNCQKLKNELSDLMRSSFTFDFFYDFFSLGGEKEKIYTKNKKKLTSTC